MTRRKRDDLIHLAQEESIGSDAERVHSLPNEARESRIDIAVAARLLDVELLPECARGRLNVCRLGVSIWITRIDEKADCNRAWHQLFQQLQPFRSERVGLEAYSGDIAAGSVEAGNEPKFDRVATIRENDGNGRGRSLGWGCRRCAAGRNDCGHLAAHQFGRQRWQSVVLTLRRAIFDCDAVALDISGFVEALQERAEVAIINMHAAEIPDHWHRRLLRPRRERPRCGRTAEKGG